MRILLLIIQFPPDVNSTGLLMAQLCEGLKAQGHELSIMTTFPHYEKFQVWEQFRGKIAEFDESGGLDILRLYVWANGRKGRMFYRLLSYLSFNALATLTLLFSRRSYDVILCTNGSFFTGLTALIGGGLRGAPFVYNVQDLYPETFVQGGQLRSRPAIAILERLERFMYRSAAHVTVITPSFKENLLAKRVPAGKVSVAPNFVDVDFIRPLPKDNEISRQLGLHDKFVVMHAGNLGYVYDLETMLESAARLTGQAGILFLIVGDGVARAALQQRAQDLNLDNVRFLPFQPQASLPGLRAAADVQVSLYRRGSARYSMPSKVYEIMASGRPLLASAERDSDVWNLVQGAGCGLCVEPEDAGQFAEAVLALYREPGRREQMGQRGREQAERHYSKAAVVARYHELLQRVVADHAVSRSPFGRKADPQSIK